MDEMNVRVNDYAALFVLPKYGLDRAELFLDRFKGRREAPIGEVEKVLESVI